MLELSVKLGWSALARLLPALEMVLLILVLAAFPNILHAKTWYVQPEKVTVEQLPIQQSDWLGFAAIQWGGRGVVGGDTIVLLPGLYQEMLSIENHHFDVPVRIECAEPRACLLQGGVSRRRGLHNGLQIRNSSGLVVSGIDAKGFRNSGFRIDGRAENIRFENCVSIQNGKFGFRVDANEKRISNVEFSNVLASHNGSLNEGIGRQEGAGLLATVARDGLIYGLTISDSHFFENRGRFGLSVYANYGSKSGGKIEKVKINGNTVYRNGVSGIDVTKTVHDVEIFENRVFDNGGLMPGSGIHVGGVAKAYAEKVKVYNNEVSGQKHVLTDGAGILIDDFVRNNAVFDNRVYANEEVGIKLHNNTNNAVYRNLIYDNPVGFLAPSARAFSLRSNIFSDNKVDLGLRSSSKSFTISKNIFVGSEQFISSRKSTFQGIIEDNCVVTSEDSSKILAGVRGANFFLSSGAAAIGDYTLDEWTVKCDDILNGADHS